MNILELFAGSRSIGKAAETRGHTVFSSDIEPFEKIDYVTDIFDFDVTKVPFIPDMIWASPPCTAFSVAAIGKNWKNEGGGVYLPKTEGAKVGLAILRKTIQIINYFQIVAEEQDKHVPIFYVENPRGMMRKMEMELQNLCRHIRQTVTYCQYGETRMKPTDIFTNDNLWFPATPCRNGDPCHERAPRGARTGTQGIKGAYNRSKVPEKLCLEVIQSAERICNAS